ncbi:MAG: amidohydrolase [Candidatus Sumerlaeaceae bacterium]
MSAAAVMDTETLQALKRRVVERVESLRDQILATSRHLHDNPELSGEEYESAKLLAGRAEANGFAVEHGIAGLPTAFKAVKAPASTNGECKPRIAFLAEYDALPVVGHGCGHNMIGTAGTYAAIGLAAISDELPGQVELFGTPAEETVGGKIIMLEAGAFEGVSAALMMHPGIYNEVAYSSLACISVQVEFRGRSAHAAASAWKGINALDAMIQLFVNVDMARKQLPPSVRMPGVILSGGERANMVPDYTKGQFSLRGKDKEEADLVYAKFIECAKAAALATGATMTQHIEGYPYYDMRPDPVLADLYHDNWMELGGEEPHTDPKPHGSLDIGNLSHQFPCLHPSVRITYDESIGGHTHEFREATITDFGNEQLVRAIKALALTGLEAMYRPDIAK